MMPADQLAIYDAEKELICCSGAWDLQHLDSLQRFFSRLSLPDDVGVAIDASNLEKLDSAGAWLINHWQHVFAKQGISLKLENFTKSQLSLIEIIADTVQQEIALPVQKKMGMIAHLGKLVYQRFLRAINYLNFVGFLACEQMRIVLNPHHWRLKSLTGVIYKTGYQALPIIAVLTFMVGVVMSYQMAIQLLRYGANIYIVDFLGLSILREFGPLITAIMVAGRTGSAFTAELGMMKLNQEIDALNTMGVTPAELLIIPRIVGLVIVLPLLTIWADFFSMIGGIMMSKNMLGIGLQDFLIRFPDAIPLKTLLIGLGKAPIFALLIASIGCYQGMNVEGSADSLGKNTTRSVVLSIFSIIIVDALFSIVLSKLNL